MARVGPAFPPTSRISVSRRAHRRRTVLAACGALSTVVLLMSAVAWGLTSYVNDALRRVYAATAGGYSGPLNVLVAGVDARTGLTRAQQLALHVGKSTGELNSDTLLLVHISADRSKVTVVSIPRDSWVDIPGHGMNKINAAFGLGGPALSVRTIEHATGLTINHFVEINFLGFVNVINALGGVDICLPQPVDDPYSGLHLSAGAHHVNGVTALKYARDRHSFATSDLARISDQQSLLSTLLSQIISAHALVDPLRLAAIVRSVSAAVTVDRGLNLAALADQLRGISTHNVAFLTVPLSNVNYLTPTGESAVLWNPTAASQLFRALKADRPLSTPSHPAHHARHHQPPHPDPAAAQAPPGTRTAAQAACR